MYMWEIQSPQLLQEEKAFVLHKPHGKSLYVGILIPKFVLLGSKAAHAFKVRL